MLKKTQDVLNNALAAETSGVSASLWDFSRAMTGGQV